jgi:hypothetical protein
MHRSKRQLYFDLRRRCDDSKSSIAPILKRAEEFRPAWQCAGSKKNSKAKRFKATPVFSAKLVWLAKLSERKIVRHRQRASLVRFQGNLLG